MRYIPNSPGERRSMLADIGLERIEDLFDQIPDQLKLREPIGVGDPMSEPALLDHFRKLASKNGTDYQSFLGAGAYSHFIPVIIDSLISRAEFFTAYTPYQPELSQGTLQYTFEFQTMICQLAGMEVANASLYDGSTAVAEAVLMAHRVTRRNRFVIADTLHPQYREVVSAYTKNLDLTLDLAQHDERGTFDQRSFGVDKETAAIVVQSPNFFGCIEDVAALAEAAHEAGALLIVAITESISLGLLRSPGSSGADIVVAEGQSFGVPLSFGGPYLGLFATREKYARQIPGRLVGEAYDKEGRRGFVLTLATREQHIRREKATSNICTNEGLIALAATVYLETMGRRGIQEVARQCAQKTAFAARRISEIEGFSLPFTAPRFNEFVVGAPIAASELLARLAAEREINGGLALSRYFADRPNDFLVCVTELNSRAEIEALVAGLSSL